MRAPPRPGWTHAVPVEWGFDMRMRAAVRVIAVSAALSLCLIAGVAEPASAVDYPSWSDVQKARKSTARKAQEIKVIQAYIAKSEAKVAAAQQAADAAGAKYQAIRERVDTARDELTAIEAEVARDKKAAAEARQRTGQLVAQLTRAGGGEARASLLLQSSGGAADFLAKLGQLSKLTESNSALVSEARSAQNTAASTQARQAAATKALVDLQRQAKTLFTAAVDASRAADAQLADQQETQATLKVQLVALTSKTETTLAGYKKGVAEALKAAAASAGSSGAAGAVAASGWALPASGPITDGYGYRADRPAGANPFHRGVDIGAGCSAPIYAATGGTVVYASWFGTYGNFIEIDHGDGLSTGYAHIRPGGTFVHVGDRVSAGQNIASTGTTGASTGCHLHFEVRRDEVAMNPVPFMAGKGITIG